MDVDVGRILNAPYHFYNVKVFSVFFTLFCQLRFPERGEFNNKPWQSEDGKRNLQFSKIVFSNLGIFSYMIRKTKQFWRFIYIHRSVFPMYFDSL